MEARQSPFMLPSCLDRHATPSHENGDRVPCNPRSTRQYLLAPATAPGSPAVPCSKYTHAHGTEEERKKRTESAKRNGENKEPLERPRQVIK